MDSIADFLKSFGISKEDYENNNGGLIGKFSIPNAIIRYNPDLENQPDKVFYLIANTIFGVINSIVKNRLVFYKQDNYENFKIVVGQTRAENLKSAVYEELKQRTLSNYFPELSNQSTLISNAVTLNTNQPTLDTTVQLVNPTALNLIIDSKWEDLPLKKENFYDNALKYFANKNLSNVNFGKEEANKFLQIKLDGSVTKTDIAPIIAINVKQENDEIKNSINTVSNELKNKVNNAQLSDYLLTADAITKFDLKADKNYVDLELEKKANKSDLLSTSTSSTIDLSNYVTTQQFETYKTNHQTNIDTTFAKETELVEVRQKAETAVNTILNYTLLTDFNSYKNEISKSLSELSKSKEKTYSKVKEINLELATNNDSDNYVDSSRITQTDNNVSEIFSTNTIKKIVINEDDVQPCEIVLNKTLDLKKQNLFFGWSKGSNVSLTISGVVNALIYDLYQNYLKISFYKEE
ncbi:hypothetical protein [[Mycoplasma] testudinis]|uniref:hypothetical protein n=1 Tax=[Mycoplasma] testudinis TaxID=33924 RepID=UPI00047F64C0|nr:hypothetical protein [[Mycoplasma] testudinis]